MRHRIGLLIWIAGLLFPIASLGRVSTSYQQALVRFFGPEWVHIALHLVIYMGFTLLVLKVDQRLQNLSGIWKALAFAILVGIAQESLQWLSSGYHPGWGAILRGSIFDLEVDLIGVLIGVGIFQLQYRKSRPRKSLTKEHNV